MPSRCRIARTSFRTRSKIQSCSWNSSGFLPLLAKDTLLIQKLDSFLKCLKIVKIAHFRWVYFGTNLSSEIIFGVKSESEGRFEGMKKKGKNGRASISL